MKQFFFKISKKQSENQTMPENKIIETTQLCPPLGWLQHWDNHSRVPWIIPVIDLLLLYAVFNLDAHILA